jgi:hypothetical protein
MQGADSQQGANMAVGWMSVLKMVPWSDVISNAPMVADGAKKLWSTVAKKTGTAAAAEAEAAPSAAHDLPAAELLAHLQAQLARQDARIGELHQQMLSSSELIQSLAEQNTQLVQRVEANRVRVRWLTLAVLLLGLGLGLLWGLGR